MCLFNSGSVLKKQTFSKWRLLLLKGDSSQPNLFFRINRLVVGWFGAEQHKDVFN